MPQVKIKTSAGPVSLHYTISTPTQSSAKRIDPSLPIVLFLHPVYIAQEIFQPQFSDPQLRAFNLVAVDARLHGETTGRVGGDYNAAEAAEDISKFMVALKLPACHFVGLSMGTCIAIQLAINHPEKVLSLFLVSPLYATEARDIAEGRAEIFEYWTEGFRNPKSVDKSALLDAINGALQLGFNSVQSTLINSLATRTLPLALKSWSPTFFEAFRIVSVDFFTRRRAISPALLSCIRCPVQLVHCAEDIAFPVDEAIEFAEALRAAGVCTEVVQVEGACHFGTVTHAREINPILCQFVIDNYGGMRPLTPSKTVSPFEAGLVKAGWDRTEDDEDYYGI